MDSQHIIDEYLAKAKEAEEHAARSTDPAMKESWLGIALSYRQMAQTRIDAAAAPASVEQPSQIAAARAEKSEDGL